MEFKHRGDDDRTSTYFASSSSGDTNGYFTEQALRAGYVSSDMGKNDFMRNPMNVRAAIQREIEKERIRDEIIAAERRALEMEVRRELLLERELALQRRAHAHGFSLMASSASMLRADQRLSLMVHPEGGKLDESFSAFPTRAESGMHQAEGARLEERLSLPSASMLRTDQRLSLMVHPEGVKLDESVAAFPTCAEAGMHEAEGARLEERLSLPSASMLRADQRLSLKVHPEGGKLHESFAAFPTRAEAGMHQAEGARLEERLSLPPPSEVGALEKLLLQRSSEPRVGDVKRLSEAGKGQVLFFAKPTNSILAGMKRKVMEPPAAITGAGAIPSVGSKKKPQEWRCALCDVIATSEKGLRDHLQGRKHKAKEAALLASKSTSKNPRGSTSSTKGTDEPTKTAATIDNPKPIQGKKQKDNKKQHIKQDGDAPLQKKQETEDSKNTGGALVQKKQKLEALKSKFKFWCEMCQVGTHGRKVMNHHQKGKKHLYLLEKLKKENGSIVGTTTSLESTHENPKNMDTETKETNGEIENVDGEVDGVEEAIKEEVGEATEGESAEVDMVDRSIVEESTELPKDDSGPSSPAVAVVEGHEN